MIPKALPFSRLLVVGAVVAVGFWVWNMVRNAVQLGGDESMEFAKVVLCLKHPELLDRCWNDQPWVYTQMFAALAHAFPFQVCMRLFSLLCTGLFAFVALRGAFGPNGTVGHGIAIVLILSWPGIQHLFVSAMCELPVTFLVWSGIVLLCVSPARRSVRLGFVAGLLVGFGVSLKLTGLMWMPVFALALLWPQPGDIRLRAKLPLLAGSGLGILVGLTPLLLSMARGDGWQLIMPHLVSRLDGEVMDQYRFRPVSLVGKPVHLLAVPLFLVFHRRMSLLGITGIAGFLQALVVHGFHVPFWWYYALHFAIPLSLLGGMVGAKLLGTGRGAAGEGGSGEQVSSVSLHGRHALLVSVLFSLWVGFYARPLYQELSFLAKRTPRQADRMLSEIRARAQDIRWGYSRNGTLMALAGVPIPPELTVLSRKRFWTGEISEPEVFELVRRYAPEAIIVSRAELQDRRVSSEWRSFLDGGYTLVQTDPDSMLYLAKRFNVPGIMEVTEYLKGLGL